MNYRLKCEAVKSASLGSSSEYLDIPCDRDAVLENVIISSRTGITCTASPNFSKFEVKKGSDILFQRSFQDTSPNLSAKTPEVLAPLKDSTVDSTTCLTLHYVHNGTGLAQDLDVVLVFRPSRP